MIPLIDRSSHNHPVHHAATRTLAGRAHLAMLTMCLFVATSSMRLAYVATATSTHTSLLGTDPPHRELPTASKYSRQLTHLRTPSAIRVKDEGRASLDFIIAGFPKCGTTSLLYAFGKHNETSISNIEKCAFSNPNIPDGAAKTKLKQALAELDPSSMVKRGIKCPTGTKTSRGIERLEQHSPETRILIGMRHPVKFFQSYYNYRVTESYDKNLREMIPSVESLVGSYEWKGVSTDAARFELWLMQLGKTNVTIDDLSQLAGRPNMAIRPSPFKIFLYSVEQLEDTNEKRAASFRNDMQKFLGIRNSLPPFGHENLNHFVGAKAHPETIDICRAQYSEIRKILVSQGLKTQEWIRNQLLESPDVTAGGASHFVDLLETWGTDPCTPTL